ncbi:Glutamyl-tRNA reductase-binding protein, chloroplastic [Vitis vinifera]|uniref:Glutamyl-tRNA reductase-binding protein, chloroplastic n=1 Tax=Vitis vinifera TaxID=29760 RepID=A0A438BUG3_VITVI|nr:Glutamyl-tRNA reductase-binding protein, chloroplastic [Vitis vinifera]
MCTACFARASCALAWGLLCVGPVCVWLAVCACGLLVCAPSPCTRQLLQLDATNPPPPCLFPQGFSYRCKVLTYEAFSIEWPSICGMMAWKRRLKNVCDMRAPGMSWRFGKEVDENLLHVVSVERVLQMEDFQEVGTWVTSSDYRTANPDPLRDSAEKFVDEINTNNMEDVNRFCNIYVDLDFQSDGFYHPWGINRTCLVLNV